jgi:predicted RNase H-like nuclease
VNKQREERADADAEAEAEVDEKADGDSIDSLICAYEFRMRMGEQDSAIDAETQSRRSMAMVTSGDDDTIDSTRRQEHIN